MCYKKKRQREIERKTILDGFESSSQISNWITILKILKHCQK